MTVHANSGRAGAKETVSRGEITKLNGDIFEATYFRLFCAGGPVRSKTIRQVLSEKLSVQPSYR